MFEVILNIGIGFVIGAAVGVVVGMYILRNNLDNKTLTGGLDKGETLKDKVSDMLKK